ncbi:MAG: peptidase S8, partial [Pedobacter sp.]
MFSKLRFNKSILVLLSLVWLTLPATAQFQGKDNTVANTAFLELNGTQLLKKASLNRTMAFSRAKEKGWITLRKKRDGGIVILQGIDELGLPIYNTTYNNTIAAATTQTNSVYSGGTLGLFLSGSSIPGVKFAIWDGGAVLTNHVEFAGGRVEVRDGTTSTSTHSTHVAGTIMATGINPVSRGMAFRLPKLYSFDFTDDTPEMSANAAGLLISNHSYGSVAGWDYNEDVTPARWEFYGSAGANEDFKFGYYDSESAEWDKICFNAPYYLPVKSAGNNRSLNGPAVGSPYYRYNSTGAMVSAGNRPAGISSNDGYDIITTYGNAKNILTIGAVSPLANGPGNAAAIQISSFSSWGPTDDGRIKPDLVGDGVNVTSTSDAAANAYTTLSGTSMASPNVSGSLMLLQELFAQRNGGNTYMRAATLKGLALATAIDAGNAGPDYIYGWGLLNMQAAAKCILDNGSLSSIQERSLKQGEVQTIEVVASGSGPLVATISWTDPEGAVTPQSQALDNTALKLVNDLDLRISEGNIIYSPWVLNPASPSDLATKGDNFRDNVEQVYVAGAVPGKTYKIQFSHKGTLQKGPQAYSLVLTGIGGKTYCASKPLSNADTKITRFALSNIDNRAQNGCTDYSDFSGLSVNLEAGKRYPLTIETGTCGQLRVKSVRVFADWNGDGDFDDDGETLFGQSLSATQNTTQTTIQAPTSILPGRMSMLRVVVSETSDPNTITPCGNYAKGETQDYALHFEGPSLDAGIIALVNPLSGSCAGMQNVTVTVQNFGTAALTEIPLTAIISSDGITVAALSGSITSNVASMEQRDFSFPEGFLGESGKTYTIQVRSNLSGDLNPSNDLINAQSKISVSPTVAPQSSAYYCTNLKSYQLNSPGAETIFWYKSATERTPFAVGNQVMTTEAPIGNSYFAGLN